MSQGFIEEIQDAEMILIGLGEEFNEARLLKESSGYTEGREKLEASEPLWMLPAYEELYRRQLHHKKMDKCSVVLNKLAELIQNKNYFVVSTSNCEAIAEVPWKDGRLVTPCGSIRKKQCSAGCSSGLQPMSDADERELFDWLQQWTEEKKVSPLPQIGVCPECGKPLVLNNIYTENYDENGYMEQWQLYTKWLQGTLNRKLLVLELGVGMKFPSVIRWPFEKVAFFNQKAKFYRVNEKLYQLSEELNGKGTAIPKNSIDWLESLC